MTKSPIHSKAIIALQVQFCRNLTKKKKKPLSQEHNFPASFTTLKDSSASLRATQHSPQAVCGTEDHLSKAAPVPVPGTVVEVPLLLLTTKGFRFTLLPTPAPAPGPQPHCLLVFAPEKL